MQRANRQRALIGEVVDIAADARIEVWLRGGWAMDFFLGEVTRDHVDIDWFAWAADAPALHDALRRRGFQAVDGPPVQQQLDVVRDGEESSFAWLARDAAGRVGVRLRSPRAARTGGRRTPRVEASARCRRCGSPR
ncbi:hypothetical protein E1166_20700 [Micromonospora sp. KC213]|nr:hypothetical protein E1166_20700 [Micromonospora sp. KC213]